MIQNRPLDRGDSAIVYFFEMDRSDKFLALLFLGIYTTVSFLVFNQVFDTSSEVIDELFHLWQGYQYCVGNFSAVSWRLFTFYLIFNFNLF